MWCVDRRLADALEAAEFTEGVVFLKGVGNRPMTWSSLSLELIEVHARNLRLHPPRAHAHIKGHRRACRSRCMYARCELQVPSVLLRSGSCDATPGASAAAGAEGDGAPLGLAHVCLDVTPLGISVVATLALLQQRSAAKFDGRSLAVLTEPHQQVRIAIQPLCSLLLLPPYLSYTSVH